MTDVQPSEDEMVEEAVDATPETEPTSQQLEDEGDIAADYIEEFLDICDIDGDIDG